MGNGPAIIRTSIATVEGDIREKHNALLSGRLRDSVVPPSVMGGNAAPSEHGSASHFWRLAVIITLGDVCLIGLTSSVLV